MNVNIHIHILHIHIFMYIHTYGDVAVIDKWTDKIQAKQNKAKIKLR